MSKQDPILFIKEHFFYKNKLSKNETEIGEEIRTSSGHCDSFKFKNKNQPSNDLYFIQKITYNRMTRTPSKPYFLVSSGVHWHISLYIPVEEN